jgi:hypothetical protein
MTNCVLLNTSGVLLVTESPAETVELALVVLQEDRDKVLDFGVSADLSTADIGPVVDT